MRHDILLPAALAVALLGCSTAADDPTAPSDDEVTASPDDPAATPSDDPSATPSDDPSATPSDDASPTPSDDASPTPSQDEGVAAMAFTGCAADRFTIERPAEWEVNDPSGLVDACRVFHPEPVELPDEPQGISLHWAVILGVEAAPYADVTGADPQGEVLQERRTTVAGRDAQVIEVRSDGVALVPAGERSYRYAVDLGDGTLVASTYSVGDTPYERDKQVLDRMLGTLQLSD